MKFSQKGNPRRIIKHCLEFLLANHHIEALVELWSSQSPLLSLGSNSMTVYLSKRSFKNR